VGNPQPQSRVRWGEGENQRKEKFEKSTLINLEKYGE
jgi:hypothetical protein